MPQNTFDEKSSLVQVLAWHHLRQQAIAWANVKTLRQNGCHFRDIIFKCIFLNEYMFILMKISLIFVPKGPINNILALVQIMAWCQPGDKPLSESLMVSLLIHICITQPQWVNPDLWHHEATMIPYKASLSSVLGENRITVLVSFDSTSHWHYMSTMASWIIGYLTVCSTACSANNKETIKAPH